MFLITCERFNLQATTSDINMACGIADSALEWIGDEEGGQVTITDGHRSVTAVYDGEEYIIDGDVYDRLYDAQESVTYRIQ